MLPGQKPSRRRRLAIYFGLADGPPDAFGAAATQPGEGAERRPVEKPPRTGPPGEPSFGRKTAIYFGLADPPTPPEGPRSRYGPGVRPRLDEDVDELVRRIEDLEDRLANRGDQG